MKKDHKIIKENKKLERTRWGRENDTEWEENKEKEHNNEGKQDKEGY
jgi:hypothetical protein